MGLGAELTEEIGHARRLPGVIQHEAQIRAELRVVPDLGILRQGPLPLFDGVAAVVFSVVENAKREPRPRGLRILVRISGLMRVAASVQASAVEQ